MELQEYGLKLLRDSLGNPSATFREHQWESIEGLVERRSRLLVVQRTGWGKSSVYFISTRILRERGYGPTIIISPLLSLMRNQIDAAAKFGVRLGSINSSQTLDQNKVSQSELVNGQLDAVIISPEQLAKDTFIEHVLQPIAGKVGLFVVDEAHCISDWGHDFRPDYKRLVNILSFLPSNMAVLATTATANDRVVEDISRQLGDGLEIYRGELTRASLRLQNLSLAGASERLAWLADNVPLLNGTGIIYTATTRDADFVARWLRDNGIKAESYYGNLRGMNRDENAARRLQLEEQLLDNKLKALVATSALGMGFDKPDLGFVIHYQSPGSVIAYYQQVGRAGRAISEAWGVLMSGSEDDDIQEFFISQAFPSEELVNSILDKLAAAESGVTLAWLETAVNTKRKKIEAAVKFLMAENPAPVVKRSSYFYRTPVDYELPHEMIHRLSERKRGEWSEMQEYLNHSDCLMLFLARSLDDRLAEPCGKCANCLPDEKLEVGYTKETGQKAAWFVRHSESEIVPKKLTGRSNADSLTRFPDYQFDYRFGDLAHETGRVLSHWKDSGWGRLVEKGKHGGHFSDDLVTAVVEMIDERWQPQPRPTWVTCVPSLRHKELVPDYARRLANALGLPFIDAVHKTRHSAPQKTMENSFHQCRNLDGSFKLQGVLQGEPVFLVDDAVDSGWTLAIISALLKREGAGSVFPVALVSTGKGG
ncbi:RecQ family ATP-dependent DNA helicase [Pseudomonadota bacterium]